MAGGICWTALQIVGVYLLHHYLHSDSVYGVFATVLGLVAWLYLAAQVTVYCAEINVVLARRLWPRTIIQPPLTEADRASLAAQALQNQRRKEQRVTVTFDDRDPGAAAAVPAPRTPEEISPPAPRRTKKERSPGDSRMAGVFRSPKRDADAGEHPGTGTYRH